MMSDATKAALSAVLPNVKLNAINIHGLEVRLRGNEPSVAPEMQSVLGQAFRVEDSFFGYRTTFTLDTDSLYLEVIVAAEYEMENASSIFGDNEDLQAEFGKHIATPAVWPFVRQRVWELSTAVGLKPVLVPMWLSDDVLEPMVDDGG